LLDRFSHAVSRMTLYDPLTQNGRRHHEV
jgi:hypothetical protein